MFHFTFIVLVITVITQGMIPFKNSDDMVWCLARKRSFLTCLSILARGYLKRRHQNCFYYIFREALRTKRCDMLHFTVILLVITVITQAMILVKNAFGEKVGRLIGASNKRTISTGPLKLVNR